MEPDSNDIVYNQYGLDITVLLQSIYEFFGGNDYGSLYETLVLIWNIFSIIVFIISAILIYGIIYAIIRNHQAEQLLENLVLENERLYRELYGKKEKSSMWAEIERHATSSNPNDWKLAIIEADIALGKVLDKAGYAGSTIGDQLKSIPPHALSTLNDAWEAHKVRNQIAHQGSDFVLTERKAQEAINQYKRVFVEFGVL